MGARNGKRLDLTVAMPLLARFVAGEAEYFAVKRQVLAAMRDYAATTE